MQDQLTVLAPGALDEAQRLARLHDSDGDLPALFAALEVGGHTCSAVLDGRRPAGVRPVLADQPFLNRPAIARVGVLAKSPGDFEGVSGVLAEWKYGAG
jgi:hypothetical protein